MSTRTIRLYQRRALEELAQKFEANGAAYGTRFTCNAIGILLGKQVMHSYARVFEFENLGHSNETYLWNRSGRTQTKWRVLMLGFAAAMAATGDLL